MKSKLLFTTTLSSLCLLFAILVNAQDDYQSTTSRHPAFPSIDELEDEDEDETEELESSSVCEGNSSSYATCYGYGALDNDYGTYNSAFGYKALYLNGSSSQKNTATGFKALYSNATGSYNTATGFAALKYNTSGQGNTATGEKALQNNTQGIFNTATGMYSLRYNKLGGYNTATGFGALYSNSSGGYNTATGMYSLHNNTAGSGNTAIGQEALYYSTGHGNTAVGAFTQNLRSGSYNTAIGYRAGCNQTTGNGNIYIGNLGSSESDVIRIGTTVGSPSCDNEQLMPHTSTYIAGIWGVTIDSGDGVPVRVGSNGQLGTVSSSIRYKEAIRDLGEVSKRLLELRPVQFRYKAEVQTGERPVEYGLLAEEVAEVMPELVVYDEQGRPETVRYHILSTLLVNEVQALHKRTEADRKELLIAVQAQHEENAKLRARLSEIESLVGQLAAAQNVNLNTAAPMD